MTLIEPPVKETDHVKITYVDSMNLVKVEWKRVASGDEFRTGLREGLAMVKEQNATKWMADLREMGSVVPEDQEWVAETWFPRAQSTSLEKIASIYSENEIQQMSIDEIMSEVRGTITNHYFDNKKEAMDWLSED